MALALRQVETRADAADWLPVDEAAELLGLSTRRLQQIATANAGKGLAYKSPPRGGLGKPVWWLHRSIDKRLTRYPKRQDRDQLEREALSVRFPQHVCEQAHRRLQWLQRWRTLCGDPTEHAGLRTRRDNRGRGQAR